MDLFFSLETKEAAPHRGSFTSIETEIEYEMKTQMWKGS